MEVNDNGKIIQGDVLDIAKTLPDNSVNCIVTSPPYFGLRDYGSDKQLGLEETPELYIAKMVEIFRELRRVLRDDGTCWLNLGDSYASSSIGDNRTPEQLKEKSGLGHGDGNSTENQAFTKPLKSRKTNHNLKPKNLIGIPWRVALALQADGWYLRSDIIWHKKNPMPESVTDRPTKSHEYFFLLTKSARYWYDADAVREDFADERMGNPGKYTPFYNSGSGRNDGNQIGANGEWDGSSTLGRNMRSVLSIATKPYSGAHFAVMPAELAEKGVLAGCPARVCVECETPWVREVERESPLKEVFTETKKPKDGYVSINVSGKGMGQKLQNWRNENPPKTLGFKPVCNCNADHKPGIVLDPFFGSGTVGCVAISTQRNYIGIELNPDYIALAKERLRKTQPVLPGIF